MLAGRREGCRRDVRTSARSMPRQVAGALAVLCLCNLMAGCAGKLPKLPQPTPEAMGWQPEVSRDGRIVTASLAPGAQPLALTGLAAQSKIEPPMAHAGLVQPVAKTQSQTSTTAAPVQSTAPAAKSRKVGVEREGGGYRKLGKPYQVAGKWYTPRHDEDYEETGVASWYGDRFHASRTANGETYDMNALTAAHRTLPMPSLVKVTNLENGRSVVVRVNDRGPFKKGRIIDLSAKAAHELQFARKGTTKVHVKYVGPAPLEGEVPKPAAVVAKNP